MSSRTAGRAVADARDRFAARARARRLATARPLLVVAGAGSVLALAAWVVLSSGALAVSRLAIAGTHRLSAAEVRAAVGPVTGEALLRVDTAGVVARVSALPGVRSVTVTRDWPHTLRVVIRERDAVAAIQRSDGWYLIDSQGVEYGPPLRAPGALPVLSLPAQAPDLAARSAAAVLRGLPASLLREVVRVDAPSPSGVQLRLRGGALVVWGSADRAADKARILATLLSRRARVYDVSSPTVVTTR